MTHWHSTRAHADRLLIDLIEAYRSGGESAVLGRLADEPANERRVVAAINRLAGSTWRWAYPDWRRAIEYVEYAALGWPLAMKPRRSAVPKRRPAAVEGGAIEPGRPRRLPTAKPADRGAKCRTFLDLAVCRVRCGQDSDGAALWPELERRQRRELAARIDDTMGRRWECQLDPADRFARFVAALVAGTVAESPVAPPAPDDLPPLGSDFTAWRRARRLERRAARVGSTAP